MRPCDQWLCKNCVFQVKSIQNVTQFLLKNMYDNNYTYFFWVIWMDIFAKINARPSSFIYYPCENC